MMQRADLANASGREVRAAIREGRWARTTHGVGNGFVQTNLAIVPERYAFDFMRFCLRNPKHCPIVDITEPGDPEAARVAPGSDLRTDLSGYRVYRDGKLVNEVNSLKSLWRPDHVAFLLGCSLSFDQVMLDAGIPLRHLSTEEGRISVYISNIQCEPAGIFHGPMVVSMRPILKRFLVRAIEATARYPLVHGAPVHVGDPAEIGIKNLECVNWGRHNSIGEDEIPVFWACGITPQSVAMASGIPEMITHSAGHMFVTDQRLSAML